MVKKIEDGVWELRAPDDMHCHLRDTEVGDKHGRMPYILKYTARQFARAIAMPNTGPPVTNARTVEAYRRRINLIAYDDCLYGFEPLMVLYITPETTASDIREARHVGAVAGKFYPKGGTTGAQNGVPDFGEPMFRVYEAMQETGMLALFHGAVPDDALDVFDREQAFVPTFAKIAETFPGLRMVFEHMSTRDAVNCVLELRDGVYGSITPLHLARNRNDMLGLGGLHPRLFAMPIVQSRGHQEALVQAAVSGSPKFFAGTDSAPHLKNQKHREGGACGSFSAPHAYESYAQDFEDMLGSQGEVLWPARLEDFTSRFGAEAYGLPLNEGKIILRREEWTVPSTIPCGSDVIIPMCAGETMRFKAELAR